MKIDLHTHSTASDGQYTPTELVQKAVLCDIKLFAMTDHDTVHGLADAEKYAKAQSLPYIPGIEISAQDLEEIHILGYGIDYNNKSLLNACAVWQNARLNRGEVIKNFLHTKGIDINLDEVKSYAVNRSLGRPHFAQYLQNHGIVQTRKEAFDLYLDTEEFREATDRKKPAPDEAIKLIHKSGGKAVLAHPGIYRMNEVQLDDLINRLVDIGIDGIECFYSKHTREQTKRFISYITTYELLISCGSDFHGEKVKPDVQLGMDFDYGQYGDRLIVNHIQKDIWK